MGLGGPPSGLNDHLSIAQEDCTKKVIPCSSVLTYTAVHAKKQEYSSGPP